MYDLVIIGGGPAAVAAGVYASRKKIKAVVVTKEFGGQSIVSDNIQNWIGTKSISGFDLAKSLEDHLKNQKDIEIRENEEISSVEKKESGFSVKCVSGKELETKAVIICSGGRHRILGIPGEDKFTGRGVVFCSTCDAPLFKGKDVAVVGGGNAGLEAILDLIQYANKIYLVVRSSVKGDPLTMDKVISSGKVSIIENAEPKEVIGDLMVSGMKYKDLISGEEKELPVQGIFVEIGTTPNSQIVERVVEINGKGEIIVDCNGRTSVEGIWAAGDVSSASYNQNNVAVGDAIRATLDINDWLKMR